MSVKVTYTGSSGKTYDLKVKGKLRIKEANFHNYTWSMDSTGRKYGVKVDTFRREPIKYKAIIVFDGTYSENKELIESLHADFERDILTKTPGALTWGDYTIGTYAYESSTYPDEKFGTINEVTFFCPYPFWSREQMFTITPITEVGALETDKQYDPSYGYDYSYHVVQGTSKTIFIDHYAPCDFRAVLHGPQENLNITIGNVNLRVAHSIPDGGYMVVDTREGLKPEKHCYLDVGGVETNCFNYRNPLYTLLEKVEPGNVIVTYNRSTQLDLTIYRERSEPIWS